ncbi:NAD(P)-dependent oxidoreductase [Herbidospora galbida]|uniref:NAD(P)-dependent oxidoreductase n=1 Tax=Herbidospora galbida TaxID=2575442 RepID=A0A4U3MA64_9ACTN|nr:NAD(P)H-binding protein [Herbidospora galbida]TKK84984.1 NAD(P)-dependent oxidoreductase [Herbidospora galbida]
MTYVVTGATGPFGRLAIESLLRRGVPAGEIRGIGRQIEKAADLGVEIRKADYEDGDALRDAFHGASKLLFVSGSELGRRAAQHANVVAAAVDAGVELVAYTSILNADTSTMDLADDHRATEKLLTESGLRTVFLRNGWYYEVYTAQLATYLEHGVAGAAGDGPISAAARADLADAAAVVLTQEPGQGVYELAAEVFTLADLAAQLTEVSGKPVAHVPLTGDQYREVLTGAGLPGEVADIVVGIDLGIAAGNLASSGDDLAKLLGRRPVSLREALAQ